MTQPSNPSNREKMPVDKAPMGPSASKGMKSTPDMGSSSKTSDMDRETASGVKQDKRAPKSDTSRSG